MRIAGVWALGLAAAAVPLAAEKVTLTWEDALRRVTVLRQAGNLDRAEELLAGLDRVARGFEPADPRTAKVLDHWGSVRQDQGRFTEAESFYRQALGRWESASRADTPDHARTMSNLASLYLDTGQTRRAERLAERALEIRLACLGDSHRETIESRNQLALIAHRQGRRSQAVSLYTGVLETLRQSGQHESPEAAVVLCNLGLAEAQAKRPAEARSHLLRSLHLLEQNGLRDMPVAIKAMANLAWMHCKVGEYSQAEPLIRTAVEIAERRYGPAHPSLADLLAYQARVLRGLHQGKQAKQLEQRAKAILAASSRETLRRHTVDVAELAAFR